MLKTNYAIVTALGKFDRRDNGDKGLAVLGTNSTFPRLNYFAVRPMPKFLDVYEDAERSKRSQAHDTPIAGCEKWPLRDRAIS